MILRLKIQVIKKVWLGEHIYFLPCELGQNGGAAGTLCCLVLLPFLCPILQWCRSPATRGVMALRGIRRSERFRSSTRFRDMYVRASIFAHFAAAALVLV